MEQEKLAYALSLVTHYLENDPTSWSYVRAYKRSASYTGKEAQTARPECGYVGAHYRLRAPNKRTIAALRCVCKHERL